MTESVRSLETNEPSGKLPEGSPVDEVRTPSSEFVSRVRHAVHSDVGLLEDIVDRENRRGFYVFFSFDLVNSTLYKTLRPTQWPIVTQRFYEIVEDGLRKRALGVRLWKYVGDELLFYRRIRSRQEVRQCLTAAYDTMQRAIKELRKLAPDARTVLSVKTTLWCALVHELAPRAIEDLSQDRTTRPIAPRNLLVRQPDAAGQGQVDFLGSDIDIGFRIAKFALRQRMVVSADLAFILYKDRAADDRLEHQLKIVSYEQLKGAWGSRHYPIFWFEPSWSDVRSSFTYDEPFQSEIVQRLVKAGPIADLSAVVKIYTDVDRIEAAHEIWAIVDALNESGVEPAPIAVPRSGADVHCVAVCVRTDTRQVLIAKRSNGKRRYPAHWEFGCGQLRRGETFSECLRRAYGDDFGAELRVADAPTPVATYVIPDDETGSIPGIIFVAEVANPSELRARNHDEIDWIDPSMTQNESLGAAVPNLLATAQRAIASLRP